mgnify:CR=1 FL=1
MRLKWKAVSPSRFTAMKGLQDYSEYGNLDPAI